MAESVDALVSNTNDRKVVPVRPRLRVHETLAERALRGFFRFLSPHFPHIENFVLFIHSENIYTKFVRKILLCYTKE